MTPKEKAEELVDKMHNVDFNDIYDLPSMQYVHAIQCALIAVDEVRNLCWGNNQVGINHWNEVKQEIEKL